MGYCQALEDSGLPVDQELICETVDFTMEAAYEATAELLGRRPDVTAVFSVADSMAIAAMKALYEFGRRVPEDCSVIAIDGIESSLYTTPTLTTLSSPGDAGRGGGKDPGGRAGRQGAEQPHSLEHNSATWRDRWNGTIARFCQWVHAR